MILSVENPYGLQSPKRVKKAYRHSHTNFSDLLNQKVSQQESQMKWSLYKVLSVLDYCGPLNTTKIHEYAYLNTISTKRSLDLLHDKKIVNLKQHHDRKNNEKIFSIKRNRAIIYLNQIINHKKIKKEFKILQNEIEGFDKLITKFPKNIWNLWIFFSPKMKKKLELKRDDYLLRGLSQNKIIKVLQLYRDGYFCKDCVDSGKKLPGIRKRNFLYLTEIKEKDGKHYCEYGHEIELADIPPKIRIKKIAKLGTIDSKKSYSDIITRNKKKLIPELS